MGEFPAPWGPVCTPTAASPHLHPPVKPHLGEMGPSGAASAPGYPGGNFPARVKRSQRAGAGPRSLPGTRHCGSVSIPRTALPAGLRRKLGSPEGSGRGSLGYSRDGVTGKEPREQPQAGHGVIVRSLPTGSLAQDTLQGRWPCPDTSDPAAQGVNRVPAPPGDTQAQTGRGAWAARSQTPFLWPVWT